MRTNPTIWVLPILLFACWTQEPEGATLLPIVPGRTVTVEWTAPGGVSALWLDLELDHARGLTGPIRVFAEGREIVSGTFSSAHKRVEGQRSLAHNWASTPWGVSGQVHLWDLPAVAAGTVMSAELNLRANAEATVNRVVLQVREPSLL